MRCGLIRGITLSVRHIKKTSDTKKMIPMTGYHSVAQFWMSWLIEAWGAGLCAITVCAGSGCGFRFTCAAGADPRAASCVRSSPLMI